jgi:hypothetical protein
VKPSAGRTAMRPTNSPIPTAARQEP